MLPNIDALCCLGKSQQKRWELLRKVVCWKENAKLFPHLQLPFIKIFKPLSEAVCYSQSMQARGKWNLVFPKGTKHTSQQTVELNTGRGNLDSVSFFCPLSLIVLYMKFTECQLVVGYIWRTCRIWRLRSRGSKGQPEWDFKLWLHNLHAVILPKLFNLSQPQCPLLWNGNNSSTFHHASKYLA